MAQTHVTPSLLLLGLIVSATAANSDFFRWGGDQDCIF
jgi:hypothetical protein